MGKPKKLCELCHKRPAAVPDRERMGRPINRVCIECHRDRLRGDVVKIIATFPAPIEPPPPKEASRG